MEKTTASRFASFLLFAVLMVVLGCAGSVPRQTQFMDSQEDVEISSSELRYRLYDFVPTFTGTVERAADEIIRESSDSEIQRQALIWKIVAATAVEEAAFQPDPLVALLDVWALCLQMKQYFENGAGAALFGPQQEIAVEAAERLEDQIADIASLVAKDGDNSGGKKIVVAWADQHPLTDPLFVRESTATVFAAEAAPQFRGGLSSVGTIEESIGEMQGRMKIYATLLPRQSRWEAELLFEDMVGRDRFALFLDNVDTMRVSLSDIQGFFDEFPEFVADERGAVFASLEGAGVTVLQSVDEQRAAILAEMKREGERLARLVREERIATLAEIEAMSQGLLAQGEADMRRNIDHVFLRAAQLLGGFLLVGALLFVGGVSWYRRSARAPNRGPAS